MKYIFAIVCVLAIVAFILMRYVKKPAESQMVTQIHTAVISGAFDPKRTKPDTEWKQILTPSQYHILREGGTEIPFTGKLDSEQRNGTYYSVGCDTPVFRSEQKFDSGTGWPSFWAPISPNAVVLRQDDSMLGESRTEVLDVCGGHLGHVFDDGPKPTGKRYCMNSEALYFKQDMK